MRLLTLAGHSSSPTTLQITLSKNGNLERLTRAGISCCVATARGSFYGSYKSSGLFESKTLIFSLFEGKF